MTPNEIAIVFISVLLIAASTVVIGACIRTGLETKREIEEEKRREQAKEEVKWKIDEILQKAPTSGEIKPEQIPRIPKKEEWEPHPLDDAAQAREYQLSGIYGIKMREAIAKLLGEPEIHEWRVPGYPEIIIREDKEERNE